MGAAHPPTQPLPPRFARYPVLHSSQRGISGDWGRGCVREKGNGACGHRFCTPPLVGLPFEGGADGAGCFRVVSCSRIAGEGVCARPHASSRVPDPYTPPFACHPAHAAPHAGRRARGTRKVGRRGQARGTHAGSCTHAMRGEARFPSALPGWDAFGFCAAPLHVHGAERKGGGAFPHARTQMEGGGACRAGCVPPPILAVPPTRGPCPDEGATLHSVRAGRE